MRRILIAFVICIFFVTACSSKTPITNKPSKDKTTNPIITKYTIGDYYPFIPNRTLIYEGKGNEYANKVVEVDYIKNNRIQLKEINGGTDVGKVIENKNGELKLLASLGEFYYRYDITDKQNNKPEVLLKEPIEKGTTWVTPNGNKRYISGININVLTTLRNYKCIEVTTEYKDSKTLDYYALNTGLIKSVFTTTGGIGEVFATLNQIKNNTPILQTIKFYYPDFNNDRNIFIEEKVELKTNDDIKFYFEKYFKESPGKDIHKILGSQTKINKLSFNHEKNLVHIDFSKELVREMNAGSGLESMIITCITNTLGNYFNVDKVYITIEGNPYSSGHIAVKENEPFYVNYKEIKKFIKTTK